MRGESIHRNLTVGNPSRQLLSFAAPLILSNLLQTVYNMVDMIVIGQFVGKSGLSGVSIGGDVLNFLTFIAMGFSSAGQVLIAQHFGAGDKKRASRTMGALFSLTLCCAVAVSILCLFLHASILRALKTPAEAWDYAESYSVTCICGLVFIYGYNMVSAVLRGMGDSRHPFLFISVAAVTNLVLDLLFVAGFGWNTFGAAFATVISQGLSFLWALMFLYRNRESIGFDFKPSSFAVRRETAGPLIRLGIPMMLQSAAVHFSMLFVNSYANSYGVIASAVTGIGNKLGNVSSVLTNALGTAGSSMIGQSIGARKFARVPKVIGISLAICIAVCGAMSAVVMLFPAAVFGMFNRDAEVLELAMLYIPCAVLLFMGSSLRSPMFGLINGSGNSKLNLAVALLDGLAGRIGLALLLGLALGMGIRGFWYGNAFAGYVPFFIGGTYFLTGNWKRRS